MHSPTKIYNRQFWRLCLSSLLFFASFNMVIPELPAYLTKMGGGEFKGLIIGLFTLTAMASRPFSGKLADKIGRIPVMMMGSLVCIVSSLFYPFISTVSGFLWLRLLHGFSTGFTPTGQTAYLADVVPAHRRGEAIGILGTAGTVGMAAGPALGGTLSNQFSLNIMFYCSSLLAVVSVLIIASLKETLPVTKRFSPSMLKIGRHEWFEPRVWVPCFLMTLTAWSYGTVFTLLPDMGGYMGIKNKGLPFTFLTVASLTVRLLAGKASDMYGRQQVLRVSTLLMGIGMAGLAFSTSSFWLLSSIVVYGLAQGMTSPTLLAWATDLSDVQNKGKGISSLYIFMEFGIGLGAIVSGMMYSNDHNNFFITFLAAGFLSFVSFIYLVSMRKRIRAVV